MSSEFHVFHSFGSWGDAHRDTISPSKRTFFRFVLSFLELSFIRFVFSRVGLFQTFPFKNYPFLFLPFRNCNCSGFSVHNYNFPFFLFRLSLARRFLPKLFFFQNNITQNAIVLHCAIFDGIHHSVVKPSVQISSNIISWLSRQGSIFIMTDGGPYIGSTISLISQSEIRYEGCLYSIDTVKSTVTLSQGEKLHWPPFIVVVYSVYL